MLTQSPKPAGAARLRYLDADIQVLTPGDYVACAVTEKKIPIAQLKYWSVDLQEAYSDASAATIAMLAQGPVDAE